MPGLLSQQLTAGRATSTCSIMGEASRHHGAPSSISGLTRNLWPPITAPTPPLLKQLWRLQRQRQALFPTAALHSSSLLTHCQTPTPLVHKSGNISVWCEGEELGPSSAKKWNLGVILGVLWWSPLFIICVHSTFLWCLWSFWGHSPPPKKRSAAKSVRSLCREDADGGAVVSCRSLSGTPPSR